MPVGYGGRLNARLAEASPADFSALKWYTARKGETLLTVARRFGVSRSDVAEANNLSVKARLHPDRNDHSARAGDPAGRTHGAPGADRGRVALAGFVSRNARGCRTAIGDADHLSRAPWRHALLDCETSSTPPSRRSSRGTVSVEIRLRRERA